MGKEAEVGARTPSSQPGVRSEDNCCPGITPLTITYVQAWANRYGALPTGEHYIPWNNGKHELFVDFDGFHVSSS